MFESRAALQAYQAARLCGGEAVLEVAVGGGEFYSTLQETPELSQCVGVDLSAQMLARTRRRLAASGAVRHSLCRASALALPLSAASFDILFNLYMLDLLLVEDVPAVLREFGRVLKPGGRLIALSMARQASVVNAVWMWLYRRSPLLVGGCRPLPLAQMLAANGWTIDLNEQISQSGFRSELIVAHPPAESGS